MFSTGSKIIIRSLFFFATLTGHNRRTFEVLPHTSTSCVATISNHTPTFFQNYPLAESPCSLGHNFINQAIVLNNSPKEEETTWDSLFNFLNKDHKALNEDILVKSNKDIAQIYMRNNVLHHIEAQAEANEIKLSEEWKAYFKDIGNLVVESAITTTDYGVCDTSAGLGIVTSLKDQLIRGYRETVGRIVLEKPEGHAFTVINFKHITDFNDKYANDPAKAVKNIEEYSKILKAAEPGNPQRAVTICDAWLDYHGSADDFAKAYIKKNLIKPDALAQQSNLKINTRDYSIPSFRKDRNENNPKFRCFIKNNLLWMLSIFDNIRNIHQINPAHIEAQMTKRSVLNC